MLQVVVRVVFLEHSLRSPCGAGDLIDPGRATCTCLKQSCRIRWHIRQRRDSDETEAKSKKNHQWTHTAVDMDACLDVWRVGWMEAGM